MNHIEPELINLEARVGQLTQDTTLNEATDVDLIEETYYTEDDLLPF